MEILTDNYLLFKIQGKLIVSNFFFIKPSKLYMIFILI
jgi:hypothetical protein